jgi:uncharacterized protein with PIN domain
MDLIDERIVPEEAPGEHDGRVRCSMHLTGRPETARRCRRRGSLGRRRARNPCSAGDAYALARKLRLPLLFEGEDFRATDIVPVP